jgi:peptidoglycan/LPS O-acetylase OafA/YrhL
MTLGALATGRDNNLNLLRLLAACAVLISHSFVVSRGEEFEPLRASLGVTLGSLAVDVFFVISGFLVTRSLAYRRSGSEFVAARILRIYPGLIVHTIVTLLLVAPLVTSEHLWAYFADASLLEYAVRNFTLNGAHNVKLPGVATMTNGSLWTLPVEASLYAMLLCGWLVLGRGGRLLKSVAVVVLALAAYRYSRSGGSHLLVMFSSGAVYYLLRDRVRLSWSWAAVSLALMLLATAHRTTFQVTTLCLLPYLVLCLAYLPRGAILAFNRVGDYSYGLYIYAFPIQLATMQMLPGASPWDLASVSGVFTLLCAVLSWHLVEHRALQEVPRAVLALRRIKHAIAQPGRHVAP